MKNEKSLKPFVLFSRQAETIAADYCRSSLFTASLAALFAHGYGNDEANVVRNEFSVLPVKSQFAKVFIDFVQYLCTLVKFYKESVNFSVAIDGILVLSINISSILNGISVVYVDNSFVINGVSVIFVDLKSLNDHISSVLVVGTSKTGFGVS